MMLDNFIVIPNGMTPPRYDDLKPIMYYPDYHNDVIRPLKCAGYRNEEYHVPDEVNANAGCVTEYWVKVLPEVMPNPREGYYVSSFGRIYSAISDRIKYQYIRKDGYIGTSLAGKAVPVHRIELYSFYPIPNFKEMTVNHINFNVRDNCLWNLEWLSLRDNIVKSRANGNCKRNPKFLPGEANERSTISDKKAEIVGQMLSEGCYNFTQIANYVGTTRKIVQHIKMGEARPHIADKYNLRDMDFTRVNRRRQDTIGFGPVLPDD